LEYREQQVSGVRRGILVHREYRVYRVFKVSLGSGEKPGFVARKDYKGSQVLEQPECLDRWVYRVQLVLREVLRVRRVRKGQPALQEGLVARRDCAGKLECGV
jgi:hypothetical protein